ncbi:hypothetical protein C4564_03720 [Candidatus Microgenomates bacterium]|nr:MAG: hypothetical protein C4564_03720 [Candidatus Microgenomates bacterium]
MIKIVLVLEIVIIGVVAALGFGVYLNRQEIEKLALRIDSAEFPDRFTTQGNTVNTPTYVSSESFDYDYKEYLDNAIATLAAQPEKTTMPISVSTPKLTAAPVHPKAISYISLTGGYSTKETDWIDVPGAEVWIDVANDYGSNAVLVWDAFIREEHGNGNAYARLYDATHNIEVAGSVVYTNNQASTLVASSTLQMWSGKNLYKVQLKSQKSFYVFFDSGRIKVTY